jgi:hypothetical protein
MCLLVAIQQLSFAPDGVMYPITKVEVFYSCLSMIFSGSIFVYLVGAGTQNMAQYIMPYTDYYTHYTHYTPHTLQCARY